MGSDSKPQSIFTQVRTETPDKVLFEVGDGKFFVLNDLYPQMKTHLLVIPKKEIATIEDMNSEQLGVAMAATREAATKKLGLTTFRIMVNFGSYQHVKHVHFHILSDQES